MKILKSILNYIPLATFIIFVVTDIQEWIVFYYEPPVS